MRTTLITALVAGALATGCYGTTSGSYGYSGGMAVSSPDLVYVSPGVSVIADYDEPIFYSDGYYWRNNGGAWYRSGEYSGGWVSASAPYAVVSIGDPYRYRHYRPAGYVARGNRGGYGGNRGYYGGNGGNRGGNRGYTRPATVDHRNSAPARGNGGNRGGRGPVVRDHRR